MKITDGWNLLKEMGGQKRASKGENEKVERAERSR